MKQLMQKNPSMTAVFAFSDVLAIGAAKAAFAGGKKIPEDISIIGFDGIEMTEFYNPALDTVYQPATEMALSAVSMLHGMMNGEKSQHMVYDSVIMKRGSVKKVQEIE
jgi:LacI family transcriptional regulator